MTRDRFFAVAIATLAILATLPALAQGISENMPLPKIPADFDPEKVLILACLYLIRDANVKQSRILEQVILNKTGKHSED